MAVNRFKHLPQPTLHVIATNTADVREVEPDGSVLSHVRFVGKIHDESSYQEDKRGLVALMDWHVVPGGVHVPFSARLISELKLGHLLPGNGETAALAGVPFPQSKDK
jgi:hypothetical protein